MVVRTSFPQAVVRDGKHSAEIVWFGPFAVDVVDVISCTNVVKQQTVLVLEEGI